LRVRHREQTEVPPDGVDLEREVSPDGRKGSRLLFKRDVHSDPGERHYNPLGTVHGGIAATLLDSAMGVAVHTTLDEGQTYTTLELNVNYVGAMTQDTGPVVATGSVIHRGGRVATAEARLTDADGRLLAHGTSTCLIL